MRIERPDREPDLSFEVVGQPKTAGSKDPHARVMNDGTVKMWVSDQSGDAGKAWRQVIGIAANAAMRGRLIYDGPLYVEFTVLRKRGPGHFGTGRNAGKLLPSAPAYPATKPDAVKLGARPGGRADGDRVDRRQPQLHGPCGEGLRRAR